MGAAAAAPLFLLNVDKGLSVALVKGHSRESGRTGGREDEKMTMTMTYMYTETRRHRVFFIKFKITSLRSVTLRLCRRGLRSVKINPALEPPLTKGLKMCSIN